MNAKSDCITQNMGMSQQKPRHASDNCVDGSALNGLQPTQKVIFTTPLLVNSCLQGM